MFCGRFILTQAGFFVYEHFPEKDTKPQKALTFFDVFYPYFFAQPWEKLGFFFAIFFFELFLYYQVKEEKPRFGTLRAASAGAFRAHRQADGARLRRAAFSGLMRRGSAVPQQPASRCSAFAKVEILRKS